MDQRDEIDEFIRRGLVASIERVKGSILTDLRPPPETDHILQEFHAKEHDEIANTVDNVLSKTSSLIEDSQNENAARLLMSLQALISAYTMELEFRDNAILAMQISPTIKGTLQKWLAQIKTVLSKLASWIWDIIKTMLTPTGWSLEGGVTIHGLADAKLKIMFGKAGP